MKLSSTKNNDNEKKKKTSKSFEKLKSNAVQNYLPYKEIKDGVICLTNGRYISVVEVFPVNFYKLPIVSQNRIIRNYKALFISELKRASFYTLCDAADPEVLVNNAEMYCRNKNDPIIEKRLDDYIEYVRTQAQSSSVTKRFFIVYEYTGDVEGKYSSDFDEIAQTMWETRNRICMIMSNCDNICATFNDISSLNYFLYEFLYVFFNRGTYRKEPFRKRIERINRDFSKWNIEHPDDKRKIRINDLIGSKGLYFANKDHVYMDGLYYTWMVMREDAYPSSTTGGWLDNLTALHSQHIDVSYYIDMSSPKSVKIALDQLHYSGRAVIWHMASKGRDIEKIQNTQQYLNNVDAIRQEVDSGGDVFMTLILITIRGSSKKEISRIRRDIIQSFAKNHVKFETAYLRMDDYFKMYIPAMLMPSNIFNKNKHNITTNTLSSFYNYTSSEIMDVTGTVIGINTGNSSLLSLDNFNTNKYFNANILILGSSGAGKSFFEQIIGTRKLMIGERCYFIIPKKGHEYKAAADMSHGTYIPLMPGSPCCINILEIRPEGELDTSAIDETVETSSFTSSYLSKKISVVCTWIQLLLNDRLLDDAEYTTLGEVIRGMFNRFGITDDDRSLFDENGEIVEMPILSNLAASLSSVSSLDFIKTVLEGFINGVGKSLNGQTNVDLSNDFIVYDVDEDVITERYLAAYMFIAYINTYDVVKSDVDRRDNIFLDEVWKMMKNEACAKQIQNMIKIVRGYGGCTIIATQELSDFLGKTGEFGVSVLNNSNITFLLKLQEKDLDLVSSIIKLSETDKEQILHFPSGDEYRMGMLIANNEKVGVKILPTNREKEFFTRDVHKEKHKA